MSAKLCFRSAVFPILFFIPFSSNIFLVTVTVETEQETRPLDRRDPPIPGALAYGSTRDEAIARVEAIGLRVLREHSR